MKLLIYITNNTQHVYPILASMLEQHIGGATVVDCEGMLRAISETSSEPPPIFGSLRAFKQIFISCSNISAHFVVG